MMGVSSGCGLCPWSCSGKVGAYEYPIACEAHMKILRPCPQCVKPRPFLYHHSCYHEFFSKKMNCKSSGIDLAAI